VYECVKMSVVTLLFLVGMLACFLELFTFVPTKVLSYHHISCFHQQYSTGNRPLPSCLGGDQKRLSFHSSQFAILQITDQHPKECQIAHICDCSFPMNSFSDKVVAVLSARRAWAFNNYSLLDSFVVDNNQYPEIIVTFKSCTR
jgi:hypothetical protein